MNPVEPSQGAEKTYRKRLKPNNCSELRKRIENGSAYDVVGCTQLLSHMKNVWKNHRTQEGKSLRLAGFEGQ